MKKFRQDNRSVSETIGFIVLTFIVLTSVSVILVYGGGSLNPQQAEVKQAEESFKLFGDKASEVSHSLDPESNKLITLGISTSGTSKLEVSNQEEMSVILLDLENDNIDYNYLKNEYQSLSKDCEGANVISGEECASDYTMGSLKYSNGDNVVLYEGGNVWTAEKGNLDEGVQKETADFIYNSDSNSQSLTVSLVSIHGFSGNLGSDRLSIFQSKAPTGEIPNSFTQQSVIIRIDSPHSELWQNYLSQEFEDDASLYMSPESTILYAVFKLDNEANQYTYNMNFSSNPILIRST